MQSKKDLEKITIKNWLFMLVKDNNKIYWLLVQWSLIVIHPYYDSVCVCVCACVCVCSCSLFFFIAWRPLSWVRQPNNWRQIWKGLRHWSGRTSNLSPDISWRNTHTPTHPHPHTHTYTYTHIYTLPHPHIYTHTYTHIHTFPNKSWPEACSLAHTLYKTTPYNHSDSF